MMRTACGLQCIRCREGSVSGVVLRIRVYEAVYVSFETVARKTYRNAIDGQKIETPLEHPHHRSSQLQGLAGVLGGSLQKY